MTKRSLALHVCALALVCGPAYAANDYLYPIRDGRKFGFINRTGTVVVPPQYDAVGECREGRIRVSIGSLSGYIDYSGKVIVEPKWEGASDFRESRAVVRQGSQYSLIDPSGKVIAEIPYRVLGDFHQGLLRIQASGRTNSEGKRLPTTYGFVDTGGKLVIPAQFMPASEFPDDPSDLPFAGLEHEWCYFDRSGKIIIRISMGEHLTGANSFSNGRLRVKEGFNWGYKDANGDWAIPPKYNDAEDFVRGQARVQEGDKWILIDTRGKKQSEGKKLKPMEDFYDGLALTSDNGLQGWIDSRGELAFPLRKYEEAHHFSDGMARIRLDDLYGFLDKSGALKIPNQYPGAGDFDHGLAFVQTREGYGYIDTKGAMVWKSAPRPKLELQK